MSTPVTLKQKLYLGGRWYNNLPDYKISEELVALNCQLFSETHVEEPKAQFQSYVCGNPGNNVMFAPSRIKRALTGTGLAPQEWKKACQGIGGHLGEGVAATVFVEQVLRGNLQNFAHLRIGIKPTHRCPDFVVFLPLRNLYQYYGLSCPTGVNVDIPLPVPVEVKSRQSWMNLKTIFQEALGQLIYYWWRVVNTRPELEQVVGYGIVAVFSYANCPTLYHCFSRPKSQECQRELIVGLKGRKLHEIRACVKFRPFLEKVAACLERVG